MKHRRWKVAALSAVAAVVAATTLSACGSEEKAAGGGEASVTVGVLPLADYGPVYWAQDKGLFEKQGLEVKFEPLQGGPVGLQQVVAGQLDFSFSNPISSAIATSKGAPVETVSVTSGWGEGELGVFVKPDSPIQDMADLDGKTVGINTTQNVGDVLFANLAKSKGVEAEPNWVEVPFPAMIDGVKNGSVDAGYLPEPFATAARAAGLRDVASLIQADNVSLPGATFITSKTYAAKNPETVEKFAAALDEAREQIAADTAAYRAWMPDGLGLDVSASEQMNLPDFSIGLTDDGMQKVADILIELGLVKDGYAAAEYNFDAS
ncbi:transporter substrate-binding domain-containing protein [Nocardioides albidus]|uniref:Transporter substrate-binding domain-containing protein n=1 Tax=Nocardioides albidus TaxID=1517589 RepID=A0A5C4VM67_9ACTN|nr:ABC transporter substrate-binding protein [Nocardioides albidus]TNM36536.1 transporter substrate-binding domain-containing protein [Nocardioides albidus]